MRRYARRPRASPTASRLRNRQPVDVSHSHTDKLVRLANQIAIYFQVYPHDEAVDGVAEHLRKFWEPRMMNALKAHIAAGGEGLHILVPEGVRRLG